VRRLALLTTVVTLLSGCATAPERKPPELNVDVPGAWTSEVDPAGTEGDARWWESFGDGALDAVVDEALRSNYGLRSAAARVDQAAALVGVTRADRLPNLSAGARASRSKQNLIGIPIPGGPDVITTRNNSFGVSLDTRWEIDLWGRVRKAESAALANLEASQADLAGLRLSIAAQTTKAWFAVIEAREQVRLAEETVASYASSADQVRRRYEQGVRTSLDLRLALSSLASARDLHVQRRQQLDVSSRQLEILLGRYPAGVIETGAGLPTTTGAVPAGMPSELLIRRPDLFAAERRFAAAEARVSQARRAFFPSISLTGSAGTLSNQLEDLADGNFGVWSIAAGLVQPIFQGGRLIANLSQSNAASDAALAEYAGALLAAFGEVESALFAETALANRERYLSEATSQAEAARELAERQYNNGLIDYVTMLETQRQALSSRSALIAVRRARLDARVNLHLALGGGFELDEEWARFLEPLPEDNPNGGSK
jgi:multidrug efflux system outer membrane protein